MKQNFPHLLIHKKRNKEMQIVHSEDIKVGDEIFGEIVKEVTEKRKARGNWENWNKHPNWFKIKY